MCSAKKAKRVSKKILWFCFIHSVVYNIINYDRNVARAMITLEMQINIKRVLIKCVDIYMTVYIEPLFFAKYRCLIS